MRVPAGRRARNRRGAQVVSGAAAATLARRDCLGQRRAAFQVVRASAGRLVTRGAWSARHLLGPPLLIRRLVC